MRLVGLLALGVIGAPYVLGALAMLGVGDLMRAERNGNESVRGRIALSMMFLVGGLISWLPDPVRLGAVVLVASVVVLLAYVPALLVDQRVAFGRAVVRSIDLTFRAAPGALASATALAAYLVGMPSLVSFVRSLSAGGDEPDAIVNACAAAIACVALAGAGSVCACVGIGVLSAEVTQRTRQRPTLLGIALTGLSLAALVWLSVVPALLVRFDSIAPVGSLPVAIVASAGGPLVVMQRDDGQEFAVVCRRQSDGWWIGSADLASARTGQLRSTPLADDGHAVTQARTCAVVLLVLALLACLATFHFEGIRRALRRSHVVVVRFARGDVDGPRGAPVTRAGAQLFVVGAGQTASLRAPMRISGELPDGLDPDEWIEASLVTRGPWSRAVGYRAGLSEPPPGARLIVGTHADALTDARLEDMERFIAALSLAPLLAMAVALVF